MYIDPVIKRYIVDIVQASRNVEKYIPSELSQYVAMGASTRASIAFMEVARAVALTNGRTYCTPEDVRAMSRSILGHRIQLNFAAMADGIQAEQIVDAIIGSVRTP